MGVEHVSSFVCACVCISVQGHSLLAMYVAWLYANHFFYCNMHNLFLTYTPPLFCTHTQHTHSVFIRDCKGCRCLIACQQFRVRDCHRLEVFLHCQSQPVTENATAIKFGCFQGGYDGLVDQCEVSKLSPFVNQWAQVHDFTPVPDTDNWTLFPAEVGRQGLPCCV